MNGSFRTVSVTDVNACLSQALVNVKKFLVLRVKPLMLFIQGNLPILAFMIANLPAMEVAGKKIIKMIIFLAAQHSGHGSTKRAPEFMPRKAAAG